MADLEIQRDFKEGVQEIYQTLFTDGATSGVRYFEYSEVPLDIYKENRRKFFKAPILLVAKVEITPEKGDTDIEMMKNASFITIPFKSLDDNKVDVSSKGLKKMRQGYLEYDNIFYEIVSIRPQAFVEDIFLTYKFTCIEDVELTQMLVREGISTEIGVIQYAETENDWRLE